MTDDWLEAMDQGGPIFLDLRKAFDVANHDMLVTVQTTNVRLFLVSITVAQELLVRPSTACQHYRNLI